ncbi:MAG: phosphonate C-P lyase system protein PhnL [Hyphomicrobiaceae bacterium]
MEQPAMLALDHVSKTFTMHLRGGLTLPVLSDVTFRVAAGNCVVLGGPSGIGKSSVLKMIFGNYRADRGTIVIRHRGSDVDIASADPRRVLDVRRHTLGYVSQFLRCIPRISAIDIVKAAALETRQNEAEADERARHLLQRLNLPERLWALPPATFSGGEQQRVNIATGFAARRPVLLLDEPTASLDAENRAVVIDLIREEKRRGVALVGIFHDREVREAVADTIVDVARFTVAEPLAH